MQKDWFEEIISTIENNAEDNKATISNVKLWAKSWREERELALTLYGVGSTFVCGDLIKHNYSVNKIGRCIPCDRIKDKAN